MNLRKENKFNVRYIRDKMLKCNFNTVKFYCLLGIVPIVLSIWLYLGAVDRDFDGSPFVNKCNGSYHKIFLLKWGFSEYKDVWQARCGNTNDIGGLAYAKLYIQCGASSFLLVLLSLNLFEGFIYYRTWKHILKM